MLVSGKVRSGESRDQEVSKEKWLIYKVDMTHTIHGTGIFYLHEWLIFMVNVGKIYHTWMLWVNIMWF